MAYYNLNSDIKNNLSRFFRKELVKPQSKKKQTIDYLIEREAGRSEKNYEFNYPGIFRKKRHSPAFLIQQDITSRNLIKYSKKLPKQAESFIL